VVGSLELPGAPRGFCLGEVGHLDVERPLQCVSSIEY
jgi:hypothetical protein